MKFFIPFLLFAAFIFPQSVFANSHFSLKEHNFTVFFDENWRQVTDQDIEEFSSKERENLISSFFITNKNVYLYINKIDSSHPFFNILHISEKYFKETPRDLFKEDRVYKPIETSIGNKIIDFRYDFANMSLFYETEFITSGNSKYKIFSLWKKQNDIILEFNFVVYDDFKNNEEMINFLVKSIDFNFYSDTNTVPKEDNVKTILTETNKNKELNNFMEFILTKQMIYYLISAFVFFFIILLFIKYTRKN
jgi:hypothetical protein